MKYWKTIPPLMQVITCQNTGMLDHTTVELMKLQFASLLHNVGAGHASLPYRSTVPSLCCSKVFQGEWDLHERVWNRQEEVVVFLKVKGEDQIFQRHTNWETYWHLVYIMGHSDNLNLYFSDIYTGYVAVMAFQTKTPLFSKQNLHIFFTLQPTLASCGADCMDSHIPRKMLEELMSSEKHHMISIGADQSGRESKYKFISMKLVVVK